MYNKNQKNKAQKKEGTETEIEKGKKGKVQQKIKGVFQRRILENQLVNKNMQIREFY